MAAATVRPTAEHLAAGGGAWLAPDSVRRDEPLGSQKPRTSQQAPQTAPAPGLARCWRPPDQRCCARRAEPTLWGLQSACRRKDSRLSPRRSRCSPTTALAPRAAARRWRRVARERWPGPGTKCCARSGRQFPQGKAHRGRRCLSAQGARLPARSTSRPRAPRRRHGLTAPHPRCARGNETPRSHASLVETLSASACRLVWSAG